MGTAATCTFEGWRSSGWGSGPLVTARWRTRSRGSKTAVAVASLPPLPPTQHLHLSLLPHLPYLGGQ